MMMLAWATALVVGSIPKQDAAFCATVHQYLLINGTEQNTMKYGLCLDSVELKWSRSMHKPQVLQRYFNGTDRFTVNSTGGCVRKYFGKPKFGPNMMPWHMTLINPNATLNRTMHNFDGFTNVDVYGHTLGSSPSQSKINMEWYVGRRGSGPPDQFLRSSAQQPSPWKGSKMMDGVRDFSQDYVTPPPDGSFLPPTGTKCDWEDGVFRPANNCDPKCAAHSRCCVDPKSGSAQGACFAVDMCEQLPGMLAVEAFEESDPFLAYV